MRNGICIKCGRATVYSGKEIPAKGSTGNTVPIDFQHSAALDNYVCIGCGYVERYISDTQALERIGKQWRDASQKRKNGAR